MAKPCKTLAVESKYILFHVYKKETFRMLTELSQAALINITVT
jgi:hypothetical protein